MATNSQLPLPVNTAAVSSALSPSYTIMGSNPTASPYLTVAPNGASQWSSGMSVTGAVTASDVVIDGVSMKQTIKAISERLAILVPDFALMEKYAALKEAYDHYKTLEALCKDEPNV
jgi:hypothetical protein